MKYIATKNVTLTTKYSNKVSTIKLVLDKVVSPSKLKELSKRQLREYTKEVYEGADLSFLTPEDKKYYNKNKKDPDMQWALDMVYEEQRTTN
jgi:hypothetical protein